MGQTGWCPVVVHRLDQPRISATSRGISTAALARKGYLGRQPLGNLAADAIVLAAGQTRERGTATLPVPGVDHLASRLERDVAARPMPRETRPGRGNSLRPAVEWVVVSGT